MRGIVAVKVVEVLEAQLFRDHQGVEYMPQLRRDQVEVVEEGNIDTNV
mgnify:CR=1 FL=1